MHHPMRELCYKVVIVGKVGYCSSVISAHVVALAIFALFLGQILASRALYMHLFDCVIAKFFMNESTKQI